MITLLIMSLAVFRLSEMLVYEKGPFDIFETLRDYFGVETLEAGLIGKVLGCVQCTSVWVAAIAISCVLLAPVVSFWVMAVFAVSGASILLSKLLG